ncbi:MAG: PHP domain-containing protein [Clostridia bacterium]|nr:PHP domain-containing protein [Clostridia bacterium]
MSFADLHLHSLYSDGSDTPAALAEKLLQNGFSVFALTDHDSIRGVAELQDAVRGKARAITGVEFSCLDEGEPCHILAYGFDLQNETILSLLKKGDDLRLLNFKNRREHLARAHSIVFTEKELAWLHSLPKIGKPHIARILIARGLATDTADVIRRYLDGCKEGDVRLPANEVIPAILKAGGIPVWAHPLGGEGERHLSETELDALLSRLIAHGIRGMECYYSRYTEAEIALLLQKAHTHALAVSGGSDYHGENKTVRLGALSAEGLSVAPEQLSVLTLL